MIVGALSPPNSDVSKHAYDKVEMFFIVLGLLGIVFGLWLNYEGAEWDVVPLNEHHVYSSVSLHVIASIGTTGLKWYSPKGTLRP